MPTVNYFKTSLAIISTVLYKLPGCHSYTRITQRSTPRTFAAFNDVPLTGGYVVMPFEPTSSAPIVLIEPTYVEHLPLHLPTTSGACQLSAIGELAERSFYADAFAKVKAKLTNGALQKIVLSRRLHVEVSHPCDEETLFLRACHNRPDSYVALWSTPQTGAWLVATPEPLLRKSHSAFSTVALAGTQPAEAVTQWSEKNQKEQAIVAQFVEQAIRQETADVHRSECHTLCYGNLHHLCTDFTFTLRSEESMRRLLQGLHPTPAVCGWPQGKALHAIIEAEQTSRMYYAGFSGPLCMAGETHLFVSLRCMQLRGSCATLYAGGGIMPESTEQEEWDETCRKLETMLEVLRG